MADSKSAGNRLHLHFRRYLLTGLLTVVPLWITFVVFRFVLEQLSQLGLPSVRALARGVETT